MYSLSNFVIYTIQFINFNEWNWENFETNLLNAILICFNWIKDGDIIVSLSSILVRVMLFLKIKITHKNLSTNWIMKTYYIKIVSIHIYTQGASNSHRPSRKTWYGNIMIPEDEFHSCKLFFFSEMAVIVIVSSKQSVDYRWVHIYANSGVNFVTSRPLAPDVCYTFVYPFFCHVSMRRTSSPTLRSDIDHTKHREHSAYTQSKKE